MKKIIKKISNKTERGQVVILLAFAIVGLVAMMGLVIDTGFLLISYGKLKRGVDAAAVAAAQQYREPVTGLGLNKDDLINTAKNFIQLNETLGISDITVHSCEDPVAEEPILCNKTGDENLERKLVQVNASTTVILRFLSVIGIESTTISASAVGEAAALDVVLIIDTSASMAYETDTSGTGDLNPEDDDDPDDNPAVCNAANNCQPMNSLKAVALDFIDTLYFPYDRVGLITLTSITKGTTNWELARAPLEVQKLTPVKAEIEAAINSIRVFEPRDCDGNTSIPGNCIDSGGMNCPYLIDATSNPASCFSSNIGGALMRAKQTLTGTGSSGSTIQKLSAFWVVVAVLSGPPNATEIPRFTDGSIDPDHPHGYCPASTWYLCRDRDPWARHTSTSDPAYDADDYARDQADALAKLTTGDGVTIYAIGLGEQAQSLTTVNGLTPAAEGLFQYIAECAGENDDDDCETPVANPKINHGQYFFSPTSQGLADIFKSIASNIATKISQ